MSEAAISFSPDGTAGIDKHDAIAMPWNNVLQITTASQGVNFTINGLPSLNQNYSLPLTIKSVKTSSFVISAKNLQNILSGACITLHDKYGVMADQDLRGGNATVTINDTETVARFVLNITVNPLTITTNTKQASCTNKSDGLITAVGTDAGPWNYIWKDASGSVLKTDLNKSTADSLSGLNNGVYSVEVSTVGACNSAVQTFTLTAPALPVAAFTAPAQVNIGDNVNFVNASTGATNYIWYFGTGDISSLQTPNYVYNTPGTYSVVLDAISAPCNDTVKTTQVIVVDASTSIKQMNSGSGNIILSQDGTGNYLQFDYSSQTKVNIIVYNVLGQVLLNNAAITVVNDKVYLHVSEYKNQVLYVTITNLSTNQQITKRFVNE